MKFRYLKEPALLGFRSKDLISWVYWLEISFLVITCFRPLGGLDAFRQAQTIWPTKIWSEDGFSPFNPTVPIKGIQHQTWLLEFPLYQWLIFITHSLLNIDPILISRLMSLCLALVIVNYIARQLKRFTNQSERISILIIISNPYMFYWMTTGLVDWLALALGVIAGHFLVRKENVRNIPISLSFGILGALVKPSHALFSLLLILLLSPKPAFNKRNLTRSASVILPMVILSSIWQRWIAHLYPLNDPRSIWSLNESTFSWYFGTTEQYSHFSQNVLFVVNRLAPSFGGTLLISILFFGFMRSSLKFEIKGGVTLLSLGYLIGLINLNVSHYYYQIPIALVIGIISVTGISHFVQYARQKSYLRELIFVFSLIFGLSIFSTSTNLSYIKSLIVKEPIRTECLPIVTSTETKVITINWENPAFFYECNLRSFQINLDKNTDAAAFATEKMSYSYLYALDQENKLIAENYLESIGGTLQKLNKFEHWYRITWTNPAD